MIRKYRNKWTPRDWVLHFDSMSNPCAKPLPHFPPLLHCFIHSFSLSHTPFLSTNFSTSLLPPLVPSLSLFLHIFLWNPLRLSRRAEMLSAGLHKFCLVWNRRWIPRTAGRFFITRAFLVASTATTTCHQTHAGLRVYVYVFGTWRSKCMVTSKKPKVESRGKNVRCKGRVDEERSGEVHRLIKRLKWWFVKEKGKKKTIGSFSDKINMQLMGRFSRQGANK